MSPPSCRLPGLLCADCGVYCGFSNRASSFEQRRSSLEHGASALPAVSPAAASVINHRPSSHCTFAIMLGSVGIIARPVRLSLRPAVLCSASHPTQAPRPHRQRSRLAPSLPCLTSSSSLPTSVFLPLSRCFSSFTIVVPSLGDSITEGSIAELTKGAGEAVDADDVVARLETDKVSMDIRSPNKGVLKTIKVKQGDTVKVGDVLMEADTEGGGGAAAPEPAKEEQPKAAEKKPEAKQAEQQQAKPAPQPPQEQQPAHTEAIDSADQSEPHRAHHPLIHFRHGRREETAPATLSASNRVPASAAAAASPAKPASSASNTPTSSTRSAPPQLDAASYFNVSGWQEGNDRWAGVRKSLPARYAGRRVGETEQELIMMGGAQPYTPAALMQPSKADKDKQQPAKRK